MNKYIYVGNDQAAGPLTMNEPKWEEFDSHSEAFYPLDNKAYHYTINEWKNHLKTLPRIDIVGEHSFADGQILEVEKDIGVCPDIYLPERYDEYLEAINEQTRELPQRVTYVAIPLKQIQKDHLTEQFVAIDPVEYSKNKAHEEMKACGIEPNVHSTNEDSLATLACTSGNAIEQDSILYWKSLINAESKEGWWDFFHYPDEEMVKLVRFGDNERISEQTLNYKEWEDLAELVVRISKLQSTSQEVKGNTTHQGWINLSLEEFKRYMAHAYHVGAVDTYTEKGANEQGFTSWFNEIVFPLLNKEQGVAQRELSVATMPNHGTEPSPQNSFTEEDMLDFARYCAKRELYDFKGIIYAGDDDVCTLEEALSNFKICTPKEILTNFLKQQKGA